MKSLQWYKEKYPSDDLTFHYNHQNGIISCPYYFVRFLIDKTGVKSKKFRIIKKVCQKEFNRLLKKGLT